VYALHNLDPRVAIHASSGGREVHTSCQRMPAVGDVKIVATHLKIFFNVNCSKNAK